ncbi:MAG: SDR family oxidoreductase [Novosphingobium sp.]|nr:SDR family oxidoreductase [Novosphingobium sp.]
MSVRKVVMITGAATGVGAASARWFAARGYDVLVNYRASRDEAEDVAQQCRAAGVEAVAVQGDVAKDNDCRNLAQVAKERWGCVDVLINSAGATLFRPMSDLDALDAQDFSGIFGVNVVGPYQMTRAIVPLMEEGGSVVNISSIAGLNGTGSSYAYAASKGALNTLTLALARNLAPRIRVNALLPGMIEGRWLRDGVGEEAYDRIREKFAGDAALKSVATPDEVAATAGWLAVDAGLMTGQLMVADNGILLGRPPEVR